MLETYPWPSRLAGQYKVPKGFVKLLRRRVGVGPVARKLRPDLINWLQVLGTTETPHIDQGVRHQLHPIVALLDVLETEEQPLAFVLPANVLTRSRKAWIA